jgi:hypothetical protein
MGSNPDIPKKSQMGDINTWSGQQNLAHQKIYKKYNVHVHKLYSVHDITGNFFFLLQQMNVQFLIKLQPKS